MYWYLSDYAYANSGNFPSLENSDSSPIGELFPDYCPDGGELAGLSGDKEKVIELLKLSKNLPHEATSWHLVSGLTTNSNPRLALLWEKSDRIYASSRRWPEGGHAVLLVDGTITNVPKVVWGQFISEQQQLRSVKENVKESKK